MKKQVPMIGFRLGSIEDRIRLKELASEAKLTVCMYVRKLVEQHIQDVSRNAPDEPESVSR